MEMEMEMGGGWGRVRVWAQTQARGHRHGGVCVVVQLTVGQSQLNDDEGHGRQTPPDEPLAKRGNRSTANTRVLIG